MQITTHAAELRKFNSGPIAFVPTMGALHEGHATLFREARKLSEHVVASVFINPLQFEDGKDLKNYPRTPEADMEIAEHAGVSTLWLPGAKEIYPGPIEEISPGPIGALFEGAHRNGHFAGVLTVVKRLFDLVSPTWALFGEKDFQQFYLIRQMVHDLSLGIEIVPVPIVREKNGLAISSRNVRLESADRTVALVISRALIEASQAKSIADMQRTLDETLAKESGFVRDYAAVIDESNFELAGDKTYAKRALIAGWVNGVRLIDNMSMTGHRP
ncbi:MAG TPA: pantoate--beta-alanine ligase [Candidatus Nanopelagicaceae bacterium]